MNETLFTLNNLWLLISTVLVFIMHLGFSTLEAGLVRQKNTVNILFKNTLTVAIGILTYYIMGFNLMYPGADFAGGFFGFSGFGISAPEGAAGLIEYNGGNFSYYTDFIFQAMFAATCATIVSGAVAERIKIEAYLIFCVLFVMISYPITGMWKWGGGWLNTMGFYDFAGSTLVHAAGGFAALAGIILIGPRIGKYTDKGIKPIPGHSMPLAAIGVFLLWFGWYGFNGGSVLSANPEKVSLVFVTTTLAACAGAVASTLVSYLWFKTFDFSMALNGVLGGLVGVTAGADVVSPGSSIVIGLVSGIIIPFAVVFFDKVKLDDPVGATSVHLACGVWGTLAVGIFGIGDFSFLTQLIGVAAVGGFSFIFAFIVFYILKLTIGLRVNEETEINGLDKEEHNISEASVTYSLEVR